MPETKRHGQKHDVKRHGKIWYSGGLYADGKMKFATFAGMHLIEQVKDREFLVNKIKKLAGNPKESSVLEIGPGDAPVAQLLPFKNRVFLEKSPSLSKYLRRTLKQDGEKVTVLTGGVESFRFKKKSKFGVCVMNEVLTHVPQKQRMKAIKRLAGLSESFLIVDRPSRTLKEIMKWRANAIRQKILSYGKELKQLSGRKKLTEKEKMHLNSLKDKINELKINSKLTVPEAKRIQATLIDFDSLKNFFEKKGWKVNTSSKERGYGQYIILTAKKK